MTTPNFVAVVCVVDSSLALLAEWQYVFGNYVTPLFQRLHEIHPGYQFRIGIVCYATACTRPSPLLSKSYFTPPQTIFKDLREEPSKHGIGQTGSGGFRDRPLWNSSSRLDTISWDNLSAELRKRDIHYSNILLQTIPALSKFQSLVASGTSQGAWFPLRSPHGAHLSGFNSQKGSQGTKRVGESQTITDRSPDAKRPRVQPGAGQASPKATPKIPPAVPPTQAAVAPAVAAAPSSSGAQPPAPSASAPASLAAFASRWKAMSQVIKQRSDVMEAHKAAGRAAEAAALKAEVDDMKQRLQKMTQMLQQAHAKQQQAAQGQQSQSSTASSASQTAPAAPQRP
ncbi:hypothetical protein NLI96_g11369 [Meripilus lineatus]|uniref:Mediator of RNA polymerase II transcription subunit 25 n=1 Tax=Meripilus lineatus TaxID=2056292 RepID=A0AAD5UTB8_9APHY|nr:hypothetical protein NLI96_g11369 [Physisporinus lineatus]